MADAALRDKVLSGAAWNEFCDALKQVGALVQDPRAPVDPLDRTEGYRFLMRLVRYGFESFLEYSDPLHPVLHRGSHETIKIIHENPDNLYLGARVDGRHTYRLFGRLGTARWMSFNIHAGAFGAGGRGTAHALDARELTLGGDRWFELFLGGERRGPNWLPLPPDAGSLIVRQTFADRASERASELAIERLDARENPAPIAPEQVGRALAATPALMRALAEMALSWSGDLQPAVNRFAEVMPAAAAIFRDPDIQFHVAYFELGPDDALVVEARPPKCDYWMFVLSNHWLETLDYTRHRITLNNHSAVLEPDGTVKVVVAARDPGHPNWLDSAGHARGTIGVRWVGKGVENVLPSARVVPIPDSGTHRPQQ
ncbi:MAG: DUF1214 domain-containing protein [Deltaproteobacteria bacterium]|nr:MAG: DUF1214 domain-containing protein [Deltaproteobacteria bacterium]